MARFFIERPVFAMVIAIVTVILGAVSIPQLPIATYPEVVPPVVQITANYRGGNAQDLEKVVAQPIEQQLVGLDGMLYFYSRSSNDGVLTIEGSPPPWIDQLTVPEPYTLALAQYAEPSKAFLDGLASEDPSAAGHPRAAQALAAHRVVDRAYRSATAGGASVSVLD